MWLKLRRVKKRHQRHPLLQHHGRKQQEELGFATRKTMIIAQQLYEGIEVKGHGALGLVTYIRTGSTRISDEAQQNTKKYIEERYGSKYAPEKFRVFKNKSASQDAHEAIRPTYGYGPRY